MSANPDARDERTSNEKELLKMPSQGRSDADLIGAMARRDQSACGELYDRYSRLVFSVALRVTNDRTAAEDILHDLFLQLWKAPEKFDSARGQLAPWLAVMARNRAIDWTRRQKNTVEPEDVVLVSPGDASTEIERAAMVEKVRGVLAGMPSEQKDVLELAFFDGLTHSDIALKTGTPLGTIKTRIRSGLTAIRKALSA